MRISYVIIALNTAPYISECISSILKQKHHDQIIVIDDGSTDATSQIVSDFNRKEITLIRHEVNQGCCQSRIEGLRLCTGDYMTFIDSDDYYTKELPIPLFQKPDIIDFGMFGSLDPLSPPEKILSKGENQYFDEDVFSAYMSGGKISEILVNKLISRRVYSQFADRLDLSGLANYSDNLCFMTAFSFFARSYKKVDRTCYFYRQGTGMTTYLPKITKFRQFCAQVNALPRLSEIGIPAKRNYINILNRAVGYYNWMATTKEQDRKELGISAEDIAEAKELLLGTFGEDIGKYGFTIS